MQYNETFLSKTDVDHHMINFHGTHRSEHNTDLIAEIQSLKSEVHKFKETSLSATVKKANDDKDTEVVVPLRELW